MTPTEPVALCVRVCVLLVFRGENVFCALFKLLKLYENQYCKAKALTQVATDMKVPQPKLFPAAGHVGAPKQYPLLTITMSRFFRGFLHSNYEKLPAIPRLLYYSVSPRLPNSI